MVGNVLRVHRASVDAKLEKARLLRLIAVSGGIRQASPKFLRDEGQTDHDLLVLAQQIVQEVLGQESSRRDAVFEFLLTTTAANAIRVLDRNWNMSREELSSLPR